MKKLLILSGKGGTGKTTVSAALINLSQAQAVADCDVDAPNLHLVMEEEAEPEVFEFLGGDKAVVDLKKCIGCGKCQEMCRFAAISVKNGQAVVNEYACEGCGVCEYVCPAKAVTLVTDVAGRRELYQNKRVFSTATLKMGRGNSGKLVTDVKLAMINHAPECELAIVDGSPGIGCPVIASVSGMDLVLVVAESSGSGYSDLARLIKTAETFRAKLAVCVNKWDSSPKHTQQIEQFCRENKIPFVGKIPFDSYAVQAINEGKSIVEVPCPAAEAIKKIYQELLKLLEITK